jgi:general secretion pathway protein N
MRIRLPLRRAVFFLSVMAVALIVLLPLRVAAGWFALNGRGLAAREAAGSLWLGTLKEAQFGAAPLGDVHARLNLLPLFLGRARLSLWRDEADGRFEGAISVSRHSFGLDDLTGQLRVGALFAPLPLATLDLVDVTAHFEGGVCDFAEGEVRAGLAGEVGGILLPGGLRGTARCAEGALLLPLASQSGMEQANLRFAADGRWRIDLLIRPTDPAAIARLAAAGFSAGPGGAYVRRLDGSF